MKRQLICLLVSTLFIFGACEVINPEEGIPAYIHLTEFDLSTGVGEGTNSHKITEAWLYVDNELLGAYTLPATLPVLKSGTFEMFVDPGVRDDAINSTPGLFPFYKRAERIVDLVPGTVDTIEMSTSYRDDIVFQLREEFETSSHSFTFDSDGNLETRIESSDFDVFEGTKSGLIQVNNDNPFMSASSPMISTFPLGGSPVYLEINYKSNIEFQVIFRGITIGGQSSDRQRNFLFAKEDWSKAYLNATEAIQNMINDNNLGYQIVIRAIHPTENSSDCPVPEQGTVIIDNIKLIHFNN